MGLDKGEKIFRQVLHYFSEDNLMKDDFLMGAILANEDLMVNLSLVCTFPKMRTILGLGDVNPEEIPMEILNAVAKNLNREPLCISVDGNKVGRKDMEKLVQLRQRYKRTAALYPLPCRPYGLLRSTFDQVPKFKNVQLLLHTSGEGDSAEQKFIYVAMVEFGSDEELENMLKLNLACGGAKLIVLTRKEFDAKKLKEGMQYSTGLVKPSYPRGLIVAFRLEKQGASDANEDGPYMEANREKESPSEERQRWAINYNSYKKNMDFDVREDLMQVFKEEGKVMYIEFKAGAKSGYIRFQHINVARAVCNKGKFKVKNFTAVVELLTAEADKKYWERIDSKNMKSIFRTMDYYDDRLY